jgi:L-rhamnose mutarotase
MASRFLIRQEHEAANAAGLPGFEMIYEGSYIRGEETATMAKYCIVGEVKQECLEEYKQLHRELHKGPYRELLKVIEDSGVKEEAVFIYKNYAIVFYEAHNLDACYEKQAGAEVARRWNELMAPMFASSYEFNVSERLPVLEKVFDLKEQLGGRLNP